MIRSKIKKINPQRSNKMIYAVAAGLAVVLIVFFTLIITSGGKGGGSRSMAKTLSYLKNTEGLIEIQAMEPLKRAVIVYNSDSKNAGNFEKVAHYAALRLSRQWPDCMVQLAMNRSDRIVYSVRVRAGSIAEEGALTEPGEPQ
jgi:hypothetical protein